LFFLFKNNCEIFLFCFSWIYFRITLLAYLKFHSNKRITSIVSAFHKGKTFIISCGCTKKLELSIHEMPLKMEKNPIGMSDLEYLKLFFGFYLELKIFWLNYINFL
jgi:hypothetical protein